MKTIHILILSSFLLISCEQLQSEAIRVKENEKAQTSMKQTQNDSLFNFEEYAVNKEPSGWSQYFTGKEGKTIWAIIDDNGNKVLAQLSNENPNYHFNEIVNNGFILKNMELTVRLKGVEGKMDQGGGFVWRFIDRNNYYVVRANPLEDNVVLYKVVNGIRSDLPIKGKGRTYGVQVKSLGNKWNKLKIRIINNNFTVFLNGKEIFQVEDNTFTNAGKIGLWTKADAVSYFDNFEIKPIR